MNNDIPTSWKLTFWAIVVAVTIAWHVRASRLPVAQPKPISPEVLAVFERRLGHKL